MTKDSKPHAFILMCYESNAPADSLEKIKAVPQVHEAYSVYGVYDAMVRVKAESMTEFRDVNSMIRSMPNVRSTITMFIE